MSIHIPKIRVGRIYLSNTTGLGAWFIVRRQAALVDDYGTHRVACAELFQGELYMNISNLKSVLASNSWTDVTDNPPDNCPVELILLSKALLA